MKQEKVKKHTKTSQDAWVNVYDDNKMTNIAKNALFCKLSWKGKKEKLKDGKLTFYGHLIAGYE